MDSVRFRRLGTENIGTLLLGIWLIATAVLLLAKLSFPEEGVILAILAGAAGVLLLLRESNINTSKSVSGHASNVLRRGRGITGNLGILLLSVWLIVTAILFLTKISFADQGIILAVLAIAAGVLIFLRQGNMATNLGWLLLSVWLVVQGAMVLFGLSFGQSGIIMAVVGLAAGVLILLRR